MITYPGWNPLALNTGLATGPVRNWISDLAASGTLVVTPIAAVQSVVLANSPGSGPSTSAPATGTISEVCAIPISASPLATTSGAWAPGTKIVLDFKLVGDPEAVDNAREIDPAGAALCRIRIDDRFGIEQRAF